MLIVLLLLHTVVSTGVYYFFVSKTSFPIKEEQQVKNFPNKISLPPDSVIISETQYVIPIPVLFYILSGYFSLILASFFLIYRKIQGE